MGLFRRHEELDLSQFSDLQVGPFFRDVLGP